MRFPFASTQGQPRGIAALAVVTLVAAFAAVPAEAQRFDGTVFAGAAFMTQDLSDEFTVDTGDGTIRTAVQAHENGLAVGAHLGVRWDRFAVEGSVAWVPTKLTTRIDGLEDVTDDQTILMLSANVLYDLYSGSFFDVFAAGGVGVKSYSADDSGGGFEAGSDAMFNAGLGARMAISPSLSLRLDARDYISSFDAFESIEGSDQSAKTQHDILVTIGLRYYPAG